MIIEGGELGAGCGWIVSGRVLFPGSWRAEWSYKHPSGAAPVCGRLAAAAAASGPGAGRRPAGVSRWVTAHGTISLAGFIYAVGAAYAGEPVDVVVAGGLVDIVHAGVAIATHAQRFRQTRPTGRGSPAAPGTPPPG